MISLLLTFVAVLGPQAGEPSALVAGLVAEGRRLLDDGRAAAAEVLFTEAAAADGTLATRMWVIRSWMPQGRINDSLNAIDELATGGQRGPRVDYLYGMALYHKAKKNLADRADLPIVQMSLDDSLEFFAKLREADLEAWPDAYLAIADAAFRTQDMPRARVAIERAVEAQPKSIDAAFLHGRILRAAYTAANAQEAQRETALTYWQRAVKALRRAVHLAGQPREGRARQRLATVQHELGSLFLEEERSAEAANAFAEAMGWAPEVIDFGDVRRALDLGFAESSLRSGKKKFDARHAKTDTADATLVWWLGFVLFEKKLYEEAEQAFLESVADQPTYVNAWFYTALSRYYRRDFGGAVAALETHWERDPADLVASVEVDKELYVSIVAYLVNHANESRDYDAAAELSELQAVVSRKDSDAWNNAGFFYREAGRVLELAAQRNADPQAVEEELARARERYEKSLATYGRALELAPDDATLHNDAAVILHYFLRREFPRAKGMYERAIELARTQLLRAQAPARARIESTLNDARHNLAKLEEGDLEPDLADEPSTQKND